MAFERLGGGGDGVGAEQPAAGGLPALVGVEGGGDLGVQRVGRGEFHLPRHGEGQQRRAARPGARGGQRVDLAEGEQVEQGRGGDQRGPGEVGGAQPGEVALPGLGRDAVAVAVGQPGGARAREGEERGIAVVQDPGLRTGQPAGEPAGQGSGAAAEVTYDQWPGEGVPERVEECGRPGGGVGALAQRQPLRGEGGCL